MFSYLGASPASAVGTGEVAQYQVAIKTTKAREVFWCYRYTTQVEISRHGNVLLAPVSSDAILSRGKELIKNLMNLRKERMPVFLSGADCK
jgi:hypothetical protein